MHLDFLVTSGERERPVFAVEFDGPQHARPEQDQLDAVKNKFCHDADLPLLRITSQELEHHEQVSTLDWILARWLAWGDELPGIRYEIAEYIADLGSEHQLIREAQETGFADPSFDPSFIFDLRHPYPAVLAVTQRLHKRGVVTLRANDLVVQRIVSSRRGKEILQCVSSQKDYTPEEDEWYSMGYGADVALWRQYQEAILEPAGDVLHSTAQRAKLRWALPVGWDARAGLRASPQNGGVDEWVKWVDARARYLWPCHLPGASPYDIQEGLAEYLVLRDVERWVHHRHHEQELP